MTVFEAKCRSRDPSCLPRCVREDQQLMGEIKRFYRASGERFGTQKIWRKLKREQFVAARCTTERLLVKLGLQGVRRGKL